MIKTDHNCIVRYEEVLRERYENAVQPKTLTFQPALIFIKLQIYYKHFWLSTRRLVCVTGNKRHAVQWNINKITAKDDPE